MWLTTIQISAERSVYTWCLIVLLVEDTYEKLKKRDFFFQEKVFLAAHWVVFLTHNCYFLDMQRDQATWLYFLRFVMLLVCT